MVVIERGELNDEELLAGCRRGDEFAWETLVNRYQRIITISACETGQSAVSPGEELIGLARGFLAAGAPTVLHTLWSVDDEVINNDTRQIRLLRRPQKRSEPEEVSKNTCGSDFWPCSRSSHNHWLGVVPRGLKADDVVAAG